jgi:stalled ribosome rescue protein Dom34
MNRTVVLLDSQNARVFHLLHRPPEQLKLAVPDHHTHPKDHGDAHSHAFYEAVAQHVKDSDELLVIGHGLGKTHFKTHLETHHPQLAKKVVGYEVVDHPTDAQVLAFAVKYFKHVEPLLNAT